MAVYIDDHTKHQSLTLYNPTSRAEEIRVDLAFGYPTSDEEGNVAVHVVGEAPAGEPAANGWIRAFPRRLVLPPGGRQVVRFIARPPADLAEGEYWARALIRSRGGRAPIEHQQKGFGVKIEMETVLVIAVNYRNGTMRTGLSVTGASTRRTPGGVEATIDVARTGNAAYLGRLLVEVLDHDGAVIGSSEDVLAVYRTLRRRLVVPVDPAHSAATVRFVMDGDRDGLPPGGVLPSAPVTHEAPVS